MAFCRFCGKELMGEYCDCPAAQEEAFPQNGGAPIFDEPFFQEQVVTGEPEREPFLIRQFHLDLSSLTRLITSIKELLGISEVTSVTTDPYERNVPIVPDCIPAEENEIVIKQYNVARLRSRLKLMFAEGRLMVTNRRILFRASGTSLTGNTVQEHQFNLDEIGGVEIHKDYKFSLLSFFGCLMLWILAAAWTRTRFGGMGSGAAVVSVILGLLGMVPTFVVYKHFWFKLLCAVVGNTFLSMAAARNNGFVEFLSAIGSIIVLANLVIVSMVPNLVLKIKCKGASGAVVIGSQKILLQRKSGGDDYSGFSEVMPWEDTMLAMNELGTLIDDLQKQGDYAIEKWSN